jgi:hypothetical protein
MLSKIRTKAAAAIAAGLVALSGGGIAYAASGQPASSFRQIACVQYGKAGSASGNWMQYDWNDSRCPAGTYTVHLAPVPGPTVTVTETVTPSPSNSVSTSPSPSPSASSSTPAAPPAG